MNTGKRKKNGPAVSPPPPELDPARVAFIEQFKKRAGPKKIVCRALEKWSGETMKVTGFSKTAIKIGYPILDTSDAKVLESIQGVLKKRNLHGGESFGEFQLKNSVTYGHFDKTGKLTTVLTTTTAFLGSPFSVVVCVDWLATIEKKGGHTASRMVNKLKRVIESRRRKSYLITQSLQSFEAKKFWGGKMTSSSWASALLGLIHIYDNDFKIYEGVDHMIA